MNKISTKTKENIISYGLVLIGSIIYISLVFNKNVWLDEAGVPKEIWAMQYMFTRIQMEKDI